MKQLGGLLLLAIGQIFLLASLLLLVPFPPKTSSLRRYVYLALCVGCVGLFCAVLVTLLAVSAWS